ncbi:MAG: tRNA (guanosine(37)-N1)-methyltransferase TrmD [Spirochaetales bacterium]
MNFKVLSLFPQLIDAYFAASIPQKAVQRGLISYQAINIRDYARDKHRTCDDAPYGGGPGMVLKPEPLGEALEQVGANMHRTIYLTPSGKLFNQAYAEELAKEDTLILICGRYEGIDQRIIDLYVDDEISIGDYILSSGEVAALVVIDTIFRLIPGVIKAESLEEESLKQGLLEYPQYTRPEVYKGLRVPEVLLSGNHAEIARWRYEQSVWKTKKNRPDLLRKGNTDGSD